VIFARGTISRFNPRLAGLLLMAFSAACFSARPVSTSGQSAAGASLGSFAFTSPAIGSLTIKPSACLAGGRQFFLGGDLAEESTGMVVRLAVDPIDGPAVRVFRSDEPFENASVFRRPECRVFHFTLDSTGWRINSVDDYRLTVDVDCTNSRGETLVGKASATHCH
jgi:hypothetical protein